MLPDPRIGVIGFWSGSIGSIPSGWFLCDGTHGTPDLRNEFLVGAGTSYNPDDSAGNLNHDHAFTGDGHNHALSSGTDIFGAPGLHPNLSSAFTTGTTDNGSNLPPYYSLCKIMYKG